METDLDSDLASWALDQLAPGGSLTSARGLRDGGAPWLLTTRAVDGSQVEAVLRVGPVGDPNDIQVEAASLEFAAANNLPVPGAFAVRDSADPALLLIERVNGRSDIPVEKSSTRLRALGAFAARLAAFDPPARFTRRTRSISGVDFSALRRTAASQPLLQKAEAIVGAHSPSSPAGFVHGDLWQGNSMWVGDDLTAVIDWDCSGIGPAGIDLGSLRLDAAMCFGRLAEDDVLEGWQEVGGRASDVAYWDLVAALATPPELDWFVDATRAQGRPDLTQEIMRARRDQFLERALQRLI